MCARTCDWRSGSAPFVYILYRALLPTIQSPFSQFRRPDELISPVGPPSGRERHREAGSLRGAAGRPVIESLKRSSRPRTLCYDNIRGNTRYIASPSAPRAVRPTRHGEPRGTHGPPESRAPGKAVRRSLCGHPGRSTRRHHVVTQHHSRAFLKASMMSASGDPGVTWWLYSHRAVSGSDMRIDSMRPPVFSPKTVPRSYTRLNST